MIELIYEENIFIMANGMAIIIIATGPFCSPLLQPSLSEHFSQKSTPALAVTLHRSLASTSDFAQCRL